MGLMFKKEALAMKSFLSRRAIRTALVLSVAALGLSGCHLHGGHGYGHGYGPGYGKGYGHGYGHGYGKKHYGHKGGHHRRHGYRRGHRRHHRY